MRVEVKIPTEEELELVVSSNEHDDLVYLTIGNDSEVVQVNIEELKHALRIITTK